jgi:nucleoside 2-deoxyribosyltransferase
VNIFLSIPFSSRIDEDGNVEAAYGQSIKKLMAALQERGHTTYCALEYAEWKMGGSTSPEEEFRHDFEEIDNADKLIVLLEERVSAGVQLEEGYAYAKHKVIEVYQMGKPAWSNMTFAKLNGHEIIPVQSVDDFVEQVLSQN